MVISSQHLEVSLKAITRIKKKVPSRAIQFFLGHKKLLKIICKSIFKILQDGGHFDSGLVGNCFFLNADGIKNKERGVKSE